VPNLPCPVVVRSGLGGHLVNYAWRATGFPAGVGERLGGAKRVKVETVERVCRKVLKADPGELYGKPFDRAWQHRGKRVSGRVQAFDHCFSSPKGVSPLAAAGGARVRRLLAEGRAEAL
jgi:hypothetical protein